MTNLSTSFDKLKAITALQELPRAKSVFVDSILLGLEYGNIQDVITMIQMQARDHRSLVSEMIGEELLGKIEKL